MTGTRIIYDFGAHDGADIGYYLKKADKVVAVEAIPSFADLIRTNHPEAVATGRLVVVNCALAEHDGSDPVQFHIHRTNPVLSSIVQPQRRAGEYDRITLPGRTAASIIREHGDPWYVKIDVEHFDGVVLKGLFDAGIRPPMISAESHDISILAQMIVSGGYRAFKIVSGGDVRRRFAELKVQTDDGEIVQQFKGHSSGPFGQDIPGPWYTPNAIAYQLVYEQLGHIDIHAANDPAIIGEVSRSIFRMTWRQWTRMVRRTFYRRFNITRR